MSGQKHVRVGVPYSTMETLLAVKGNSCDFSGTYGKYLTDFYLNTFDKLGYNCSSSTEMFFGTFDDTSGNWSGQLGLLQRKEVDINLWINPYPTDKLDVIVSLPFNDESMFIMCPYFKTDELIGKDLLELFFGLNEVYYILIAILALLFTALWFFMVTKISCLTVRQKLKHLLSSLWVNLAAVVDQDIFPDTKIYGLLILAALIMLTYWLLINNWMINVMGADLVVLEEPTVMRSYDEIVTRNVTTIFTPGMAGTDYFKYSPEGSNRKAMWNNKITVSTDAMTEIASLMDEAIQQKYILVTQMFLVLCMASMVGKMLMDADPNSNVRVLLSHDEKQPWWINTHLYQPNLSEDLMEAIRRIDYVTLECGFNKHIVHRFPLDFSKTEILIDTYISNEIMHGDVPLPEIKLQHVVRLFELIVIIQLTAGVVLLLEKFHAWRLRKQGKSSSKPTNKNTGTLKVKEESRERQRPYLRRF